MKLNFNRRIVAFVFFSLLLLIPFAWKELSDLSLSKKIDHEKIASYFTCLTFAAAGLSLYFLYQQLQEMKST